MAPSPAGDFTTWLGMIGRVIRDGSGSDVPCASCTACCTSSQFIQIAPDETDALSHIPESLVFPAPGRPRGHVVLGYDERGHCPMLVDGTCSIYAHRPRTCRSYDCRVFAATGIEPDQSAIAARARDWEFAYADTAARERQAQVITAAQRDDARQPAIQRALTALTD